MQKINDGIGETLNKILTDNNEVFTQLRDVKETIEWYEEVQEARKAPGKAEAMITNKVIEKLSEVLPLEFLNITFDKIILESKGKKSDIAFNLDVEPPPIKPEMYLIILVNGLKLKDSELKISFEISATLKLEEVRILSNNNENSVKIKKMNIHFIVYLLSTMMLGQKKKKIGEMDFSVEDLEFRRVKNSGK